MNSYKPPRIERLNRLQIGVLKNAWLYEYGPKMGLEPYWTDEQWDKAALELSQETLEGTLYPDTFKDFDPSTGLGLAQEVDSGRHQINIESCLTTLKNLKRLDMTKVKRDRGRLIYVSD